MSLRPFWHSTVDIPYMQKWTEGMETLAEIDIIVPAPYLESCPAFPWDQRQCGTTSNSWPLQKTACWAQKRRSALKLGTKNARPERPRARGWGLGRGQNRNGRVLEVGSQPSSPGRGFGGKVVKFPKSGSEPRAAGARQFSYILRTPDAIS